MKKKFSFLVLTDHRVHKPGNPVYTLLLPLFGHPHCKYVHIASRGNPANESFFLHRKDTELEVLPVNDSFQFDSSGNQYVDLDQKSKLSDYDVILMRLARPVEYRFMEFLVETAPETIFINHPIGIEKTSSKSFLLNFPDLCPPIKLCYSVEEVLEFASHFPIVLKPLKEYGGKGILRIEGNTLYEGNLKHNCSDFLQKQSDYIQEEGYLAMKFLKNVGQGDKRIIVVGGEVLGASLRLPPKGSWLCNVAQGGSSIAAEIEPEEADIIQTISPILEKEGILIYGADTLVDDDGKRILSEINTLSVGGFKNIGEQSQKPVIQQTIQIIIDYVYQKSSA